MASPKSSHIYFDCNATTPTLPLAAQAAVEVMRTIFGNPSSGHLAGLQARHVLERARTQAALSIGGKAQEVVFLSGATEAIQTAIFSVLEELHSQKVNRCKVLFGATEHKAVPEAIAHWVSVLGFDAEVIELKVDARGLLLERELAQHLPGTQLICTMAVNNETGVIQDLDLIDRCIRQYAPEARWLVDSVQALGKIDLHVECRRIDYATFSGHKLYAPKGVGFLWARTGAPLYPLIVGGGQEHGMRSGTENLPGIASLGRVLEALKDRESGVFHSHQKLIEFRDRIIEALRAAFPNIEINTPLEISVPTTINFSVPGLFSYELMDLFDSGGLRLSAGSACTTEQTKPSHVLEAMGLSLERSTSALRLSFGMATSEQEVDRGVRAIRATAVALQGSCLLGSDASFEAPANLRDGVIQFRAGPTNTWVIAHRESKQAVIIDPSDTVAERLENFVRCQNLEILAILDTHSHADHESIRPQLMQILGDHLLESVEFDALGWPSSERSIPIQLGKSNSISATAIRLGSGPEARILARVPTPGHTSDSVTYLLGKDDGGGSLGPSQVRFVFCGDTVLTGGLGRTNFVSSDTEKLFYSLATLGNVAGQNALLCPAHDYNESFATSLAVESKTNPLLATALAPKNPNSLKLFTQAKDTIDQELEKLESSFQGVICGVTGNATTDDSDASLTWKEMLDRMAAHPDRYEVIDVREAAEHSVYKDWTRLGLERPPQNIPLSRVVEWMGERLIDPQVKPKTTILICRSGRRSMLAVRSLRRMGLTQIWNLRGGLAGA